MAGRAPGGDARAPAAFRSRAKPASRRCAGARRAPDGGLLLPAPRTRWTERSPRGFSRERGAPGLSRPGVSRVSLPVQGESIRLTSGARSVIKKTYEEPKRTWDRSRFRREKRTGRAAGPDRGPRREAGTAPGERGRRGDRRLARRRSHPGTGACGGRPGGHRVRGGAVRPVARSGPVVRGRRRTLLFPASSGVRRPRPGPASPGDGASGPRDGGARGGGDGASRAGARRGGGRDGRGAAVRARPPAPARGRGWRRARLRVAGPRG